MFANPAVIFYYVSSWRQLFSNYVFRHTLGSLTNRAIFFSNLFFLRHSHVSVTTRVIFFYYNVFFRLTPSKFKTAAALNSAYDTGGVPPFSFTNPHG
jgi:hypothetical protein